MAQEGTVGWAGENKRGPGFRVAIGDVWYTTQNRHAGVLEKGNTVKFTTVDIDGEANIDKVKLVSKGDGGGYKGKGGGGGGGGRKPNPEQEKRYAAQAKREEEKWEHQTGVVEPRITHANSRDHALRFLDLLVRTESLVLGKDAAKKEAVLNAKLDELIAKFVAQANKAGGVVVSDAQQDQDDFEDEAKEEAKDGFDDLEDDDFDE